MQERFHRLLHRFQLSPEHLQYGKVGKWLGRHGIHPDLWSFHRGPVARGFVAGILAGTSPFPGWGKNFGSAQSLRGGGGKCHETSRANPRDPSQAAYFSGESGACGGSFAAGLHFDRSGFGHGILWGNLFALAFAAFVTG